MRAVRCPVEKNVQDFARRSRVGSPIVLHMRHPKKPHTCLVTIGRRMRFDKAVVKHRTMACVDRVHYKIKKMNKSRRKANFIPPFSAMTTITSAFSWIQYMLIIHDRGTLMCCTDSALPNFLQIRTAAAGMTTVAREP